MGSLYDLLPRVSPYVVSCPTAVQQQMLREVVFDFCARTHAWRETISVTTEADEDTYTLTPTGVGAIAHVRDVRLDDVPINAEWDESSELELSVTPDDDQTLTVDSALLPTVATTTLPDAFLARWGQALAHGALGRLKSMQGKPWSGADWDVYRTFYERAVGDATWQNIAGKGDTPHRRRTYLV